MKIVYTLHAQNDLQGIYEYIAFDLLSPISAKTTANKIIQEVRSLEILPERNPLCKDEPWKSQGVRVLSVKKYSVFYTVRPDTDTVTVARIIYGGRDIPQQLQDTTEW